MVIEFFTPGEIKGKGNSKSIIRLGNGRMSLVEPAKNKANATALRFLFAQHAPAAAITGPVRVTYQVQYAWRKGHSQKFRACGMRPKDTRPDMGQLEKQIDDAIEAAGLIVDDAQICQRCTAGSLRHGKFLCGAPGVHVRIETMEQ